MKKLKAILATALFFASGAEARSHNWSRVAVDPVYKPVPIDTYYNAARGDDAAKRQVRAIFARWDQAFLGGGPDHKKSSWLPPEVYASFKERLRSNPRKMRVVRICRDCRDQEGIAWDRFSEVVFGEKTLKARHDVHATFSAPAPALATDIEFEGKAYHLATSVLCSNAVWFYGEPPATKTVAKPTLPEHNPAQVGLPPRPQNPAASKPTPPAKRSHFALGAVAEYADYSEATANYSAGGLSGKGSWIAGLQFFLEEPQNDSAIRPSAILTVGESRSGGDAEKPRLYARLDPQVSLGHHVWLNAGVAYTRGAGHSTVFWNPTLTVDFPYVTAEAAVFNSTPKGDPEDNPEPESRVSRVRVGAKIDEVLGGLFEGTGFLVTAGVGRRIEAHDYPDGRRREVTTDRGVEGYLQVYKSLWNKRSFDRVTGGWRTDATSYLWLEGNYGMLRSKTFDRDGVLVTDVSAPAYNVVVRVGIKFNSFRGGRGLFTRD